MSADNTLSITAWAGAITAGIGMVTLTQYLAVGGFILALASFCVNLWHKRQIVCLERERLEILRRSVK